MIRIGISANFFHADPQRPLFKGMTLQYIEERMALSIWAGGAIPIPLPDLKQERALKAVMGEVDGLILTGGADVSPHSYGEEPLRPQWGGDAIRDAYEKRLIDTAVARGVPVLGLCRGIQMLNVARGGTLWQDIVTQVDGASVHRDWEPYDALGHEVRLAPDSWIAGVYDGQEAVEVNSVHHQGLRELGRGLAATGWAPDGIVEAVEEINGQRWLVGVQWHPEWLESSRVAPGADAAGRADGTAIFAAFTAVCEEHR